MEFLPGQSLYLSVRNVYGQDTLCLLRKVIIESCRIVRFKEHLTFNHSCKSEKLVPKALRIKPLVQTAEGRRIANRASLQFIAARISLCHREIYFSRSALTKLRTRLEAIVGPEVMNQIDSEIIREETKTCSEFRMRHERKLETLRTERGRNRPEVDKCNPRWVLNLSSRQLSKSETSVLSRGLNFAPAPSAIPIPRILSAIEPSLARMTEEASAEVRAEVSRILSRTKAPASNLSICEKKALKDLRNTEDIVILPADKGRTTVVLDRSAYEEKALRLLNDAETYSVLKKDPTGSTERRMNGMLLKLKKESKLDENLYSRLRCSAGRIPLFYGLPKVHKDGVPLRPIVSFCSSPTYALSKHLAELLSPLIGSTERSVATTEDFISCLSNVQIDPEDSMVSFDVVSLFTCIPKSLAVATAQERLDRDESLADRTRLTASDICTLLEFCLETTAFSFKGTFYQQKQGTAMGSPVSSVVANLCMEAFEDDALTSNSFHVKMWKRYVDDTFVILPKSEVASFHRYLNDLNPHIQFTLEEENDGCLPFLDVKICKDIDGCLSTSVYRKPTHTDRYLDFGSHHPACHKASVVKTLSLRAFTHSSSMESRDGELLRTKQMLRQNGYPSKFIARHCSSSRVSNTGNREEQQPRGIVVLPYVEGLSEQIARALRQVDIRTYYKPGSTLRDLLVRVKDRVPVEEATGAVYQIPCKDCEKVYIGETGRTVCTRKKEHLRAVEKRDQANLLAEHAWEAGHLPDWSSTKVLHRNVTARQSRLFLESWETYCIRDRATNTSKPLPEIYRTFTRNRQNHRVRD